MNRGLKRFRDFATLAVELAALTQVARSMLGFWLGRFDLAACAWFIGSLMVLVGIAVAFIGSIRITQPSVIVGTSGAPLPSTPTPKRAAWRPYVRTGLSIIVLLGLVVILAGFARREFLERQFIVAVAEFDIENPKHYRLTETLLQRLQSAFKSTPGVRIVPLRTAFDIGDGGDAAIAMGKRYLADVVIWGWLGTTQKSYLHYHFEFLTPPREMPAFVPRTAGEPISTRLAELESFELQTELSIEITQLTLFSLGMVHYRLGEWDRAAELLRAAVSDNPSSPILDASWGTMEHYLGNCLAFAGMPSEALQYYDAALRRTPRSPKTLFNRGTTLLRLGEAGPAVEDLTEAIEAGFESKADAIVNRGNAYADLCRDEAAIADYSEAIALDSRDLKTRYNRALVFLRAGRHSEALEDFNLAAKDRAIAPGAHLGRAAAYSLLGDDAGTSDALDEALRAGADPGSVHYNRGVLLSERGRQDLALDEYGAAIECDPTLALAWCNRGQLHMARGAGENRDPHELVLAVNDLRAAVAADPTLVIARANLGIALAHQEDWRAAIGEIRWALDNGVLTRDCSGPDIRGLKECDLLEVLAQCHARLGERTEALAVLEHAIESNPGAGGLHRTAGEILRSMEQWEKAIASFSRAIELGDESVEAYRGRGVARLRAEIPEDAAALEDFSRAIQIGGENSDVIYHRGLCRELLGDTAGARRDADRALALDSKNGDAFALRARNRPAQEAEETLADVESATSFGAAPRSLLSPRAQALLSLGRVDAALAVLSDAIEAGDGHSDVYAMRGQILLVMGRHEEAASAFTTALNLGAPAHLVHADLARALAGMHNWAGARHELDLAGAAADKENDAIRLIANLEELSGLLENHPGKCAYLLPRAFQWFQLGLATNVLTDIEPCVLDAETASDAICLRGLAQSLLGQRESATRDLLEAIGHPSLNPVFRELADAALKDHQ